MASIHLVLSQGLKRQISQRTAAQVGRCHVAEPVGSASCQKYGWPLAGSNACCQPDGKGVAWPEVPNLQSPNWFWYGSGSTLARSIASWFRMCCSVAVFLTILFSSISFKRSRKRAGSLDSLAHLNNPL